MHVIHASSSGLEKGNASVPDFYRPDELKYHGKKNRGVLALNFFDEVRQELGNNNANGNAAAGGEAKEASDGQQSGEWGSAITRMLLDKCITNYSSHKTQYFSNSSLFQMFAKMDHLGAKSAFES